MRLTQEVIEKIQVAMTHTKMNGETNWKDGDEIDVCLGGTFAGDKFISIINTSEKCCTSTDTIAFVPCAGTLNLALLDILGKYKQFLNYRTSK